MTETQPTPRRPANGNPLFEIGITMLLPALVLMQLSKPERLGTTWALVLALAFPLGWGLKEAITKRKTELNADGTTPVMVTHSLEQAAQASRTLRLLDGRVAVDAVAAVA